MRVSELATGVLQPLVVTVVDDAPTVGEEIAVRWSPSAQTFQLVTGSRRIECDTTDRSAERTIARVAERPSHVAWVIGANANRITLGTRTFPTGVTLDRQFIIRVGDDVIDDVSRRTRQARTRVVDWLTEEFVLPQPPTGDASSDALRRVIIAASTASSVGLGGRLYGRTAALDLRADGGELRAVRYVEHPRNLDSGLAILTAPIQLVDASQAAEFEQTGRTELERVVREANSYLGMWDRYNEIEDANVARSLVEIGFARVRRVEPRDDGVAVYLTDAAEFIDKLSDLDVMVEVSDHLPRLFLGEASRPSLVEDEDDFGASLTGMPIAFDATRGRVHLRVEADVDLDTVRVSTNSFAFPSVRGDRTRLARRSAAATRIARGNSAIPHLGLILEGRGVTGATRQRKLKLPPAALACFAGRPTPAQRDALEVALSTPDIAVIQGPPGTGKTQVIAALQVLLNERAGNDLVAAQQILLSSYQHDAVEHAVSRTRVLGLPPARLTSRRREGARNPAEAWRERQIGLLEGDLAVGGDDLLLLREAQRWLRVYQIDPLDHADVARLLDVVLQLAGSFLTPPLVDRLRDAAAEARAAASGRAMAKDHLVLRAVRALPTSLESLRDDGPWRIEKALGLLEALSDFSTALVDELRSVDAIDADDKAVAALVDVRGRLIEALTAPTELRDHPVKDSDTITMLSAVVAELEGAVERSATGQTLAIDRFVDDLRHDPEGVEKALRDYTAVLASTVQQAVAPRMQVAKGVGHVDELRFDTVIVDEAARANPLDLMIPMSLAERRVVLVGDHRQLPHVLEPDVEREVQGSVDEQISTALATSLFERLLRQFRNDEAVTGVRRVVTLDTQFRMHPVLGDLISSVFYEEDGGLRSARSEEEFAHLLARYGSGPAAWIDIPYERGAERRSASKSRRVEAETIADHLVESIKARPDLTYGVITFYRAQERAIWNALADRKAAREREGGGWSLTADQSSPIPPGTTDLEDRVRIGTVDSFQGMEFDVVFLSATRSNDLPDDDQRARYGFLSLPNRLCVAMSRQRRLLVVCGDAAMFRGSLAVPGLSSFLELCESTNAVLHS